MSAAVSTIQDFSPFHFGEQQVQTRTGVREASENLGRLVIRDTLDDYHKAFFEELNHIHVGVRNADGLVWATTLCGQPGFLNTTDAGLSVELRQTYEDPVKFAAGTPFGAVGVMTHNRRRNKLNGIVESHKSGRLSIRVVQAIGNCPKYIQLQSVQIDGTRLADLGIEKRPVRKGQHSLGAEERAFIARADTLFLATSFLGDGLGSHALESCDCNHRGGYPGFVQVADRGTLLIPDYIGNNMFQSLGNIEANPIAGIQFVDYASGDSLQLTGSAEILYDDHSLPGAQRTIRFLTKQWVHVKGALPTFTVGSMQPSPYNPLPERDTKAGAGLKCVHRQQETHDITSYWFQVPAAHRSKPFCEAGQFASFDFASITSEILNRTWTISSSPQEVAATGKFSISVKKGGIVSTWLYDKMSVGSEIHFRGVDGDFTLDKAAKCIPPSGVLLIAGGIGITPVRVMFAECLQRGYPVVLLYCFREPRDAAFLEELRKAGGQRRNVRVVVALSRPSSESIPGIETFQGRVTADLLKKICPDCAKRETFQCGPGSMMRTAATALESLGVSPAKIHQEAFSF